uniref:Uncharacterized protein n=1 Tax=Streptomyces sp. NBC_00093 TaxID=2975649 RepID=A0AAU1ZSB0_9ACTN
MVEDVTLPHEGDVLDRSPGSPKVVWFVRVGRHVLVSAPSITST